MESLDTGEELLMSVTPEDVAVLYSWANLHGAKYRDFSASRREHRAQVRYRAAQAVRERELRAQADAEVSAAAAEAAALAAEAVVRRLSSSESQGLRLQAIRTAEAAARRAVEERAEASRRAEAAAYAGEVAAREEREIADAHASARRQALDYERAALRRKQLAGPQPRDARAGEYDDPYTTREGDPGRPARLSGPQDIGVRELGLGDFFAPRRYANPLSSDAVDCDGTGGLDEGIWTNAAGDTRLTGDAAKGELLDELWAMQEDGSGELPGRDRGSMEWLVRKQTRAGEEPLKDRASPRAADESNPEPERVTMSRAMERVAAENPGWSAAQSNRTEFGPVVYGNEAQPGRIGPAWLYAPSTAPRARTEQGTRLPLLMVFSLSGGVGTTSLVATLGRALSSHGEKVLLADMTSHGGLLSYFGARELTAGVVQSLSAGGGRDDAPVCLARYEVIAHSDEDQQDVLVEALLRDASQSGRVVLEVAPEASWLLRRLASAHPMVLVPIAPDTDTLTSLRAVEPFFEGITNSDGTPLRPFYVLNQFEETLALHLEVREAFRRQLGERLLHLVIRRSPAVSEALAEEMTAVDYAADAPVAKDYAEIAAWLRAVSPPSPDGFRTLRWGER